MEVVKGTGRSRVNPRVLPECSVRGGTIGGMEDAVGGRGLAGVE